MAASRFAARVLLVLGAGLALGVAAAPAAKAQTFQPSNVVEITKCNSFFGLFNQCNSIEKDRIGYDFTQQRLSRRLFGNTWGNASHCTQYDSSQQVCERAVSVGSDPSWDRITWGLMGSYMASYGSGGSGVGQFRAPLGVDITRNEGQYHVVFVADAGNNRIVVLSVGSTCECVRWMGTIDGSESGTLLAMPHDVAWDHGDTWTLTDDRLFIADTYNNRVLIYDVSLDPVNATMTKTFRAAVGSEGSGTLQLRAPQGIAVRSIRPGRLLTYIAISDSGNERVVTWFEDWGVISESGSLSLPGSDLVGVTYDHAGDIILADREHNRLVKSNNWGTVLLASYGNQTNPWSQGSFRAPTDVQVVRAYRHVNGLQSEIKLPYVSSVEAWTPTTGAQSHRLGVDAQHLAVTPGSCSASLSFLLTGQGSYSVSARNSSGATVRSWSTVPSQAGWKSLYWDGKNASGVSVAHGTYTFVVAHESGYTYDAGQPRFSHSQGFTMDCFSVSASAPGYVNQKGTYWLYGSAPQAATNWKWEASFNWNAFFDWDYAQNSSFTVYEGDQYEVTWQVSANRSSDGAFGAGQALTTVQVFGGGGCDPWVIICNLVVAADDTLSALGAAARERAVNDPEPPARVPGQGRTREHYGSGAWVGGTTGDGPRVIQLFSLFGTHERVGDEWPNALGGTPHSVQESGAGRGPVRVEFTRRGDEGAEEEYLVKFGTRQAGFRSGYLGLAIDPDLGAVAHDDSLGFDPETGLVWVADPDSGAIGYLVSGRPAGTRLTVRQFAHGDGRNDPANDSSAYAELAARESALTGKRGDVRFVISVGPTALASGEPEMTLIVLRAASLDALRAHAARVAARHPAIASAGTTGIGRFAITQAAPQAGSVAGAERVSLNMVPALAAELGDQELVRAPEGLREQVRAQGITAVAFAVPDGEPARIEIRVHDASGRLVRRLLDSTYDPGAYRIQWDLRDEGGARVGPGVYVAVMEAPGFRGTTRLVVVR